MNDLEPFGSPERLSPLGCFPQCPTTESGKSMRFGTQIQWTPISSASLFLCIGKVTGRGRGNGESLSLPGLETQSCLEGSPGGGAQGEQRTLCEGACLQAVAPPLPASTPPLPPMVCPSSRPGAFAFSHQLDRSGGTRGPGSRAGATAAPMAPAALWVALVIGLQLWTTGHTVPAQVGDSQGHGGNSRASHSAHRGYSTIPGQRERPSHPSLTCTTRLWGVTGDPKPGTLGAWAGTRSRQTLVPEMRCGSVHERGQGLGNT